MLKIWGLGKEEGSVWCGGSAGETIREWESVEEFGRWWEEKWLELDYGERESEVDMMMLKWFYDEMGIGWSCSFTEWLESLEVEREEGERNILIIVL